MRALIIAIASYFGLSLVEDASVENAPRYIQIGLQPFAFKWLNELPYRHDRRMNWNKETGWQDIHYPNTRLYSIVDTVAKTVTEIHIDKSKRYFAWTFLEARGKDDNPHPNGGYWWITFDD